MGLGHFCCGPAAVASVSGVARQIGRGIAFAFLFPPRPSTHVAAPAVRSMSPMRLGAGPAAPRANSSLCPTTINNAFFCDPLKLAKNIPPPGAGAATRVVTQSPPIEFDSFFHSVSPISRQNPSLVTTLLPSSLSSRRLVVSYPRAVGILGAHVPQAFQYLWRRFQAGATSKLKCPKRSKRSSHLAALQQAVHMSLTPLEILMRPNSNSAPGMINSWWPQGLDIGP